MESILKDIRYGLRGLIEASELHCDRCHHACPGNWREYSDLQCRQQRALRRLPYRNAERIVAIQELST